MCPCNNSVLSRVFTQNMLKDMIDENKDMSLLSSIVMRYEISYDGETKNEDIISEIYHYLSKSYRNEYFYKNTLLNKLLINAHRLRTTVALTEVPVGKSKADFIMINGKAVVYEIKTELDTFERLESQISDYYKSFDHVCIVTSESQSKYLLEKFANSPVGIYSITNRNTIKHNKEPEKFRNYLDKDVIFKILHKPEYENIVKRINNSLPLVTAVNYYSECKKIVCELPVDDLYDLFLKELKKRNKIDIYDFSQIPYSLRFLIYFSKFQTSQVEDLNEYLKKAFKGVK